MSQFHTLSIKSITKETDKAVSIAFNIPDALKDSFSFKAGQYITLKTTLEGEEVRRDYSLCASVGSGDLKVAVKAVENGKFSVFANSSLAVGDTLEVSPPNGRFIFEPNPAKTRTIAAFAAGSGITPVLSIIKTLLEEEPFSNVILLYGNKSLNDAMFIEELLNLKATYANRIHVHFIYSQTREADALFGRIEKSTVNFLVKNNYKDVAIEAFYLCGPEAMIHTVKDTLIENGIKENSIKFELFTAAVAPEDSKAIASDGNTSIKVVVDDEEHSFMMPQTQTILEASLKENIDAPYSCQGGVCSSCIAKIVEGTAEMRQNNILTDGEVADGLVLTCQAQPTSASIVVDYDDV